MRRLSHQPIFPVTQCIILKIVRFKMFVYLLAFLEHKHCWRVLNQICKHFSVAICQNFTITSFARVKENGLCYWDILIDSSQAKLCKIHEDFKENLETISKKQFCDILNKKYFFVYLLDLEFRHFNQVVWYVCTVKSLAEARLD